MLTRKLSRNLVFASVICSALISITSESAFAELSVEQAQALQRNFREGSRSRTFTTPDDNIIELFRASKTPGLFGVVKKVRELTESGQNPAISDPILREVQESTRSYFAEFEKQKLETPKPARKFPLLIDRAKFLGQPILAKIESLSAANKSVDYYLVVMHFNIPTVNPAVSQFKYAFARFATKFVLYDEDPTEVALNSKDDQKKSVPSAEAAQRAKTLWPVKLIAVYPVNETLGVDRMDGSKLTLQAKPEWAGASGLSATQEWSKEERYKMGLPTIISTATRFGDAAWIFYPARAQPLILGTKTTMALISVPKEATSNNFNLRIQCSLEHQLKFFKVIPGFQRRLLEPATTPLKTAISVSELCQTHAVDIPDSMLALIKSTMTTNTKADFVLTERKAWDGCDYVVDKRSGRLYYVNAGQLTELKSAGP